MKKIIIFTKASSLNQGFDGFAKGKEDLKSFDENQPLLLFDENDHKFKIASDLSKDGLYFIYDLISEEDFNKLIKGLEKPDFYILRHTKPDFKLKGFSNILKGVTEKKEKKGLFYPDIVEILTDSIGGKVNRIFEVLFTFDPKEEELTEDVFDAIYNNNSDEEIAKAIDVRDKYLISKSNK